MTNLHFGKNRGKNFLWLLENDVGWATMLMADHGVAREKARRDDDPEWQNKEAFYRYMYILVKFTIHNNIYLGYMLYTVRCEIC